MEFSIQTNKIDNKTEHAVHSYAAGKAEFNAIVRIQSNAEMLNNAGNTEQC